MGCSAEYRIHQGTEDWLGGAQSEEVCTVQRKEGSTLAHPPPSPADVNMTQVQTRSLGLHVLSLGGWTGHCADCIIWTSLKLEAKRASAGLLQPK